MPIEKYVKQLILTNSPLPGTKDKALIRLMVSRSEIDLVEVKAAFEMKYGQTLDAFIKDDISGDYKRLMLAICAGNQ